MSWLEVDTSPAVRLPVLARVPECCYVEVQGVPELGGLVWAEPIGYQPPEPSPERILDAVIETWRRDPETGKFRGAYSGVVLRNLEAKR